MFKKFIARLFGLHTAEELQRASTERRSIEWAAGYDAAVRATPPLPAPLPEKEEHIYVARLTQPMYELLESQLSQTIVNQTSTPHTVAHQLGVQHALSHLRKGFTISAAVAYH